MDKKTWHSLIVVLKQKSTIAGIASLVGTIYAIWGSELTPEQTTQITGILAALISVIAIITQPRPAGGNYHPSDYKPGDKYTDPSGITRVFNGEAWE